MKERIGIIHPGAMGVSVAASAQNGGFDVCWASSGRSLQTITRATDQGLRDLGDVADLCRECDAIVCICPPHAAEDVAAQVIGHGFQGLYLDANALSPDRTQQIDVKMEDTGIDFVDGGIIGGPVWNPGQTWLYVSGSSAENAAGFFSAGPLETGVVGDAVGAASALKMCYAAYTKGTTALLSAILGVAESLGVRGALEKQWSRKGTAFVEEAVKNVRGGTAKAWRFAGEMEEIAATFEMAGFPGGFHLAAADIFRRLAKFKDSAATPDLEDVLAALQRGGE